jgi:hypothetical protein
MANNHHDSTDGAEVGLRLLSRGFVELQSRIRAGEIVDPYALPESLAQGMEFLSRLCLIGNARDIADSVHCLSDIARRLPVGEWGVPAFLPPFRFAEARLLTEEPVAPTEECRALATKGQPDDAFEDIHHRQLRDIVQRVRRESRAA